MKKFWALLLAALLVVSILPVSALAADVPEPTPAFEQGTLTINVAFNGLPEDKIPESVKWGLKKDGAHVQDVVITAAEKWTKSLTLDPGEYELHADVDSADVGGEVAAQAVQDLLGGQRGLGAEGDDLALGVGPGVGAAGGGDLDGLVQQAGEQRLQLSLDGVVGVSLLLPALPAGAVVAEGETVVGHGCSPLFCQSSRCMGGKKKFSPILLYSTGFSRT